MHQISYTALSLNNIAGPRTNVTVVSILARYAQEGRGGNFVIVDLRDRVLRFPQGIAVITNVFVLHYQECTRVCLGFYSISNHVCTTVKIIIKLQLKMCCGRYKITYVVAFGKRKRKTRQFSAVKTLF